MLDYGLDPVGVMNNIAMLGLDLGNSERVQSESRPLRSLDGRGRNPEEESVKD